MDHLLRTGFVLPGWEGSLLQPEAVLACYGLVLKTKEQLPGAGPRVLKLETSDGPKVLKRSRIKETEIGFVHLAQEHLARRGFKWATRFDLTLDGLPYCKHAGEVFVLSPWIEARPVSLRRRRELHAAVARVAELHLYSHGFAAPSEPASRVVWGKWPEIFRNRLDQLSVYKRLAHESDAKTSFDRRYIGLLSYYWDQGATAIAMLLRTPYRRVMEVEALNASLCHHDLTHRNILLGESGQLHLIDLDYCIADTRLHDIGSLILRHCKRFGWDVRWAHEVIAAYNARAPEPVGADDMAILAALLHWPQDFWQVGLQYYIERQPWPLDRFLESLDRKTGGRREREKFLAAFRRKFAPDLGI